MIVDALGRVVSRRDFQPFGEELAADGTYRTSAQGYGQADSVRQKFTGYQKDDETGLDFAEARMYQNLHGRFTAIDPLLASGKSANPQTFNRYVYTTNRPLTVIDPTGMVGDYFSYSGVWLGHDNKDDGKIYFATEIGRNGENVDLDRRTIRKTTLDEVLKVQDQAVAITPGTDNTIQELSQEVTQGVTDGFTGIAKGVGNAPAVGLNGVTSCIFNCGAQRAYFQGSNPLEVPLPFAYNNEREASYGSASSTGTLLGLGVAGAAVAPSVAAPSVVPEISTATRTPAFLGQANGPSIAIPDGASATAVVNRNGNVTGFAFTGGRGGNGLNDAVTGVRIMNPTSRYPTGYVTYMGNGRQGVNPLTGRTIPNSAPWRHIPLNR